MHSAAGSVLGSMPMDHSFVVLTKQKNQGSGIPPRPHGGGTAPDTNQTGKAMEESFVVLPPPAASVYKSDTSSDGAAANLPLPEGELSLPVHPNNSGFHSTITILKCAFDIATTQTQVEQPLCLECMRVLSDKLRSKKLTGILQHMKLVYSVRRGATKILSEADFLKEKLKAEEEERKLLADIQETERQCEKVTDELKELKLKSDCFKRIGGEVLA